MATAVHVRRSVHLPRASLARGWHFFVFGAFLVLAIVGLMVAVGSRRTAERSAIGRMSPEARRELYSETLRSTQALCAQAAGDLALEDRCIDSAQFLRGFPECDEACVAFVDAHRRRATR